MNISLWEWKLADAADLAVAIQNKKMLQKAGY
jgi:hypothetical protein